ncbi:hypothetical protein [Trichococcus shcherbakoviae]|uniref:hypothetical protein n=1 Tax=Trichococcus shcherbakoviae TaxID=2094020 RepID=UPI0029F52A27|nr:hypothetical protein [Trichococcus shcherbakoviae]
MYKILDDKGVLYKEYQYADEAEYEKIIVANSEMIFGTQGIYFDIKKKIGKSKEGAAIPDGYYLDLKFHDEPILYFVEIELSDHDVYGHIGEQVLRFAISSEMSKHKIKTILIDDINTDPAKSKKIEDFFKVSSKFNNINELLDRLIFDEDVAVIIVINEKSEQLSRVLSKIKISADIIEAQSFVDNGKLLHRFTPFQDDVLEAVLPSTDLDDLDTIVVPAKEEGFKDVFIGEKCWYQIRISAAMLGKIKYIAAYQVAPMSAITHVAEVERIEKYKDTDKYILYFKEEAKQIKKVSLSGQTKGKAPQAPRYTTFAKLLEANTLDDLWK